MVGRVKPFAVEIRNVKCLRCGKHGHQSGDRECPLKDAIMPSEQSRLARDDPLTAILAQTGSSTEVNFFTSVSHDHNDHDEDTSIIIVIFIFPNTRRHRNGS